MFMDQDIVLTLGNMSFKMFFACKALAAICTKDHGATTSSISETMTTTDAVRLRVR